VFASSTWLLDQNFTLQGEEKVEKKTKTKQQQQQQMKVSHSITLTFML